MCKCEYYENNLEKLIRSWDEIWNKGWGRDFMDLIKIGKKKEVIREKNFRIFAFWTMINNKNNINKGYNLLIVY